MNTTKMSKHIDKWYLSHENSLALAVGAGGVLILFVKVMFGYSLRINDTLKLKPTQ